MNYWSYRASEWSRAAHRWLGDNARTASMGGILVIVVLVYLLFFFESPFQSRDMVILKRDRPDWGTVVFSLDDDYSLRVIEVRALDDRGKPGEIVWAVSRADDARDLSSFAYGQPLRGMEADVSAQPLQPGRKYRLLVKASGARGEADFTFAGGEGEMPTRRRRGG